MQAGRSRKKASQVDEQKVADNVLATADERKTSRSLSRKKCALLHDDHADHVHSPFEPEKKHGMADVQINLQASILQSIETQSSFDAEPWAVLVQNLRKRHASMHASKKARKKERKKESQQGSESRGVRS
jgi:hypothetical protein